jgi:hypothetical protein
MISDNKWMSSVRVRGQEDLSDGATAAYSLPALRPTNGHCSHEGLLRCRVVDVISGFRPILSRETAFS